MDLKKFITNVKATSQSVLKVIDVVLDKDFKDDLKVAVNNTVDVYAKHYKIVSERFIDNALDLSIENKADVIKATSAITKIVERSKKGLKSEAAKVKDGNLVGDLTKSVEKISKYF